MLQIIERFLSRRNKIMYRVIAAVSVFMITGCVHRSMKQISPDKLSGGVGNIETMPEDSSAKQFSLLSAGKVTVLVFVSPFCNTCFKTLQDVDRVLNRYDPKNLEIIGIVIEATKKQADKLAQGKHISFSLQEDPENETAAKFNIAAVPTMIVFGRNGQLLFRSTGKDSDMRNITAIIREAVNDR